jgi:hypothetical protein
MHLTPRERVQCTGIGRRYSVGQRWPQLNKRTGRLCPIFLQMSEHGIVNMPVWMPSVFIAHAGAELIPICPEDLSFSLVTFGP